MKHIKRKLLTFLFIIGTFLSIIPSNVFAEQKEYYIGAYLNDPSSYGVTYVVSASTKAEVLKTLGQWEKEVFGILVAGKAPLMTWPYVSYEDNVGATEADETLVYYIPQKLTSELNSAMNFIRENGNLEGDYPSLSKSAASEDKAVDPEAFKNFATAVAAANSPVGGCNFVKGGSLVGSGINLEDFKSGPSMGLTQEDIVRITCGGKTAYYIYQLPKGVGAGEYGEKAYAALYPNAYLNDYAAKISWDEIEKIASYLQEDKKWTAPKNVADVMVVGDSGNDLTNTLADAIGNFINGLLGMLGVEQLENVIFNRGSRGTEYYYGIMPRSWYGNLRIFYWISTVIGAFVMTASFLKMIFKKEKSVISPGERYEFMDGILNYIYAFVLLLVFPLLFYILINLNVSLVKIFASMSEGKSLAGSLAFGKTISGIILRIILAFITIKINIEYIIRSVTVAVCYAMAPVMISSLTFTGRQRSLMTVWLKELVVNIFLQTFNAIMLAFYILVARGNGKIFIGMVLAYSFIPLNKWFKNQLLGQAGVGGDAAAEATQRSAAKGYSNMMGAAAVGGAAIAATGRGLSSISNNALANQALKTKEGGASPTQTINGDNYRDNNAGNKGGIGKILDDAKNFGGTVATAWGKQEGALGKAGVGLATVGSGLGKTLQVAGGALTAGAAAGQLFDGNPQSSLRTWAMASGINARAGEASLASKQEQMIVEQKAKQRELLEQSKQREYNAQRYDALQEKVRAQNDVSKKQDLIANDFANPDFEIPHNQMTTDGKFLDEIKIDDTNTSTIAPVIEGMTDSQAQFLNNISTENGGQPVVYKNENTGQWHQEVQVKKTGTNEVQMSRPVVSSARVQQAMEAKGVKQTQVLSEGQKKKIREKSKPSKEKGTQKPVTEKTQQPAEKTGRKGGKKK